MFSQHQVSYGSSSPALSNKVRFPKFMRLASADTALTSMRIRMIQQLGWSRVATIYQSYELFTLVNDDLLEAFSKANLTVVASEVFKNSPVTQVQRLKDKDARIIVSGFYPELGRQVLCESYKIGLIYPRVIWILIGWLNVKWYMETDVTIDCTPDQMALALEGAIYTGFLYMDPFDTPTISGLTPPEFTLQHRMRNNNETLPGDILASQGYDVMWAVALGLNATMTTLLETGSNKSLEDFTYTDTALGALIHSHMLNVSFQAMKGPVSFDKNGDPISYVTVEQIQDGERKTICYVREDQEGKLNLTLARWAGGVPPRDGVLTYTLTLTLSPVLYGFMCTLAALGLLASVAFLIFNIYNRKVKFIKLSSPRINNIILIGCILTYVAVFISALEPSVACKGRRYPAILGWSLIFGALFSKTWRVHLIFTNVKLQKKVLKDSHLFLMVASLTLFNLVLLVSWSVFDPLYIRWDEIYVESREGGDVRLRYMGAICESSYIRYFDAVLFSVQGILLMLGAFLAWETKKVKVEALNDSKNIAVCIYNSAVLGILHIIITATMTLRPNLEYGITAAISFITATAVQCIIFVPKVLQYRNNRLNPEGDRGLTIGKEATITSTNLSTVDDNDHKLKQKDSEIAKLQDQLEKLKLFIKQACIPTGDKGAPPSTDDPGDVALPPDA
ncbi:gamma-aminobutyric acid type B receptor subunit 1-like [Haliotis cracherodii]|uniref:gamma-aminobutyric acid type B receptor subunit 1-like n=1 Tax=Haliotis cracherodii TaxID=6455 RepID=UPI0039ED79FF